MDSKSIEDVLMQKFLKCYDRKIPYGKEFVDNIGQRLSELRVCENVITGNNVTGKFVIPNPPDGKYYILLSKSIQNTDEYFETFFHELTHLYDYKMFSERYCNGEDEKIVEDKNWLEFYFWSEYRAKQVGYEFYYDHLEMCGKSSYENSAECIASTNYINQLHNVKEMHKKFKSGNVSCEKYLYEIFHFFGRVKAWEKVVRKSRNNIMLDFELFASTLPEHYKLYKKMNIISSAENVHKIKDYLSMYLHICLE